MRLKPVTAWSLGFLIILLSVIFGEVSIAFNDYFYHRLGINKNLFSLFLWALFLVAAYVASYYSKAFKTFLGLSYILVIPITATLVHYMNGLLGTVIDFDGVSGAIVVFKIYFLVAVIFASIGTCLGVFFSKKLTASI